MLFDVGRCLLAFAIALEEAEREYFEVTAAHARRVAYLALSAARSLDLDDDARRELLAAALLHDSGLTRSAFGGHVYRDARAHCLHGQATLDALPLRRGAGELVRLHHENLDGSGPFGVGGDDLPLTPQLLRLADLIDRRFTLPELAGDARDQLRVCADGLSPALVHPRAAGAMVAAAADPAFWDGLAPDAIDEALLALAPDYRLELGWRDLLPLTSALMRIVDAKSRFTYRHSVGITAKALRLAEAAGLDGERRVQVEIAAHLHDLGKLLVPNELIDKPGRLDGDELMAMQHHAAHTRELLDRIPELGPIARWAGNHHEYIDGSGYPRGLRGDQLELEARLVTVADLYQALTEERPYRAAWPHERAMDVLQHHARAGRLDAALVRSAQRLLADVD